MEKAARWLCTMRQALRTMQLSQRDAEKMVGRLVWTSCMMASRLGRAMLKPLYAQSTNPLRGGKVSPWLARALEWWIVFIQQMPRLERSIRTDRRQHIVCWADASGASRLVAAVAFLPCQRRWVYTIWRAPVRVLQQLIPREDNQIQAQELFGVVLALHTFMPWINGNLFTIFCDNDAVLQYVLNGSAGSTAPDINQFVGRLWIDLVRHDVAINILRVTSEANISDGPTRERMKVIEELGGTWIDPVMPKWALDVWAPFELPNL